MHASVIVEVKVVHQMLSRLPGTGAVMQVNFFIFHRTPQAFREDVIQCTTFAIHADLYVRLFQAVDVLRAREMAALIAVPNGGRGKRGAGDLYRLRC